MLKQHDQYCIPFDLFNINHHNKSYTCTWHLVESAIDNTNWLCGKLTEPMNTET